MGHTVLSGPPGLGKTSLAKLIAQVMESRLQEGTGPDLENPLQFLLVLAGLKAGDVLFIDEIHRLNKVCQEYLHSALEDRTVSIQISNGVRAKWVKVLLEPFTMVGATTELGVLSKPFQARFPHRFVLRYYDVKDLEVILERGAKRLDVTVSGEAARELARRARGTPRDALHLLQYARDVAQRARSKRIELEHALEAASVLEIDEDGLTPEDRKILEFLVKRVRPAGIRTIAAHVGQNPKTVEVTHESYLVLRGYVERTWRGRKATEKAKALFGRGQVGKESA
jgi:Holliday junction DNA helicase RuvB